MENENLRALQYKQQQQQQQNDNAQSKNDTERSEKKRSAIFTVSVCRQFFYFNVILLFLIFQG